ncbi:TPA: chromosome segregation protein SMC [Candidatus Sumerlaeota bacterium]|nr:chromosome segregation protein SMC [Candidatus Sumerlaeota bacterium]
MPRGGSIAKHMFFKRIEMTGFKSFATKTVVDFMEGVTIVVGPNGCGKSNIFDAIRWVLGEQSAKSLRGAKMGDVIFQGSSTYKPMGCAQVTLVIDNEAGLLPVDFSEVSVTRRLYRSGESEYLLNKMPCRLKDIQDLLLDTGAGTDSYSVMEQGRMDDIVRCKPEERRVLFEEAAGISKYKVRKAEALRKVEKVEQDLVRLADRVAESKTRTISLKRAAAKAEKYKALRDAADLAEKKILTLDMQRISLNFDQIEKDYREAKDRLAVVQSQASVVEARREELQLRVDEADASLRDLSQAKEDQRQYINDAKGEMLRLKNLADNERRRAEDYLKQVTDNDKQKFEITENLADINAEEARLTAKLIGLVAKQNIRRAEYDRMRTDSDATRVRLRDLRKEMETATAESQRLQTEQTRLLLKIEQIDSSNGDFNQRLAEHEEIMLRLNAEIDQKREALDQNQVLLSEIQEKLGQLQGQGVEELKARDTLRGEHRTIERQMQESRSRLNALERVAKDYEGYFRGVKTVMLAAQEHQLDGVIGVVPELITPIHSEHDTAIEVALGNHTQDVVMRTDQDAKQAIQMLKASRDGRATFLPLNVINGREGGPEIENVLGRPGVVGLASRLVAYDPYIQKVVFDILGRTIITENIDVSMRLTREGKRNRYVTLEGELTAPSGAMTGGSRQQSQIMSRQREVNELAKQVETLTEQEADFARRIRKREESAVALDAQCAKSREAIQDLRLKVGQGETELAGLRDQRDQRESIFNEQRERAASSQSDIERCKAELEVCQAAVVQAETLAQARRDELATLEESVYERNAEAEQMGESVNQNDQEITHLRARSQHLRENAATFNQQRQNMLRRETQIRNDHDRALQAAQDLMDQSARVEAEKIELEREIDGIDEKRLAAAKAKEEAQQANHEEMMRSQQLMSEFSESNNRHAETQELFVNAQSELKQVRARSLDRFSQEIEVIVQETGEVSDARIDLSDEIESLRDDLARMGDNVNMGALVEYAEENERYEFLTKQENDLMTARDSLRETIDTVDKTTRELFQQAFDQIRTNFIEMYRTLFGGGRADLVLQDVPDGDPLLDGGVEIVAQPPGKKLQTVSLLSGGEKALTAVALMFAIFQYKPSPFCVMDEIDAPLDDANVGRFRDKLREFSANTQFIIVTHNKITMELADTIYGITMQETGVSSVVSVNFDQVERLAITAS